MRIVALSGRVLRPPTRHDVPQREPKSSVQSADNVAHLIQREPLIQPCSWLDHAAEKLEALHGWPEYLWHVQERQLVDLRTDAARRERFRLRQDAACHGHLPEYMNISHTWGCWTKNDEPGYGIPNGFECLIPRIKIFRVEELPQSLCDFQRLKVSLQTTYD